MSGMEIASFPIVLWMLSGNVSHVHEGKFKIS